MAGDSFTSAIFRWLNCVASDRALPPAAFKLAYIISQHINRGSHCAWPSQATLAEAMGIKSDRSVRRLVEALVANGHLITTQRRQSSLVYRLAQDRTELSGLGSAGETNEEQSGHDDRLRPDKNDRSQNSRPDIPDIKTGQNCPVRPDKNVRLTTESNHLKNQRESATLIPDDFELLKGTYNWALNQLGSNEAVERSVSRFKNHFRQVEGRTAKSRDWDARARNWIDDDASKQQPDKSVVSAAKRLHEKILSFDAGPEPTDGDWESVLSNFVKFRRWTRHVDQFGPDPSSPECRAPKHLLIKYGVSRAA